MFNESPINQSTNADLYLSALNVTINNPDGQLFNWTIQTSGTIGWLRSIFFTDVNTGYAVSELGEILNTTNGGTTWTIQKSWTYRFLKTKKVLSGLPYYRLIRSVSLLKIRKMVRHECYYHIGLLAVRREEGHHG